MWRGWDISAISEGLYSYFYVLWFPHIFIQIEFNIEWILVIIRTRIEFIVVTTKVLWYFVDSFTILLFTILLIYFTLSRLNEMNIGNVWFQPFVTLQERQSICRVVCSRTDKSKSGEWIDFINCGPVTYVSRLFPTESFQDSGTLERI